MLQERGGGGRVKKYINMSDVISFVLDWMQQSELINSVPRIGRRSFSPIAKSRGEGFRFYGGDLPRSGIARREIYGFPDSKDSGNPTSKSAKNWRGFWEPAFGGGLQGKSSGKFFCVPTV